MFYFFVSRGYWVCRPEPCLSLGVYSPVAGAGAPFFYAVHVYEAAMGPSASAEQRAAIATYLHAFAHFFSKHFILGTLHTHDSPTCPRSKFTLS